MRFGLIILRVNEVGIQFNALWIYKIIYYYQKAIATLAVCTWIDTAENENLFKGEGIPQLCMPERVPNTFRVLSAKFYANAETVKYPGLEIGNWARGLGPGQRTGLRRAPSKPKPALKLKQTNNRITRYTSKQTHTHTDIHMETLTHTHARCGALETLT